MHPPGAQENHLRMSQDALVHAPSSAPATELARALRELEPRASALLRHRLLDGRTADACAALYGVSRGALEVHLLRACLALEARLAGTPREAPEDPEEEQAWAAQLGRGLEGRASGPGVAVARRLQQLHAEVQAELAAAEQREARSPARRRSEWLRRLAVALLIAFTAWYALGRTPPEPSRPAPVTR